MVFPMPAKMKIRSRPRQDSAHPLNQDERLMLSMTELIQSRDVSPRRSVYPAIKELSSLASRCDQLAGFGLLS